ncbi:MAG: hypothetical protein R6V13_02625 [Anaerolineae bacterium]
MKRSPTLIWLSAAVATLASVAAAAGLFWRESGESFPFTTLRGEEIQIYGRGLYHYEWAFRAPVLRGADAVLLFVGIPLLVVSIVLYRRGSLRGGFLLTGTLAVFLYNGASLAFGAAYNDLFLLYVAYFSTSLYAFALALGSIDLGTLPAHVSSDLPRRGIAIFIFVAGLSAGVWLMDIIAALAEGGVPPNLAGYTTDVTAVIDVGVILPTAFLTGVMLLRRKALGYPLAATLLTLLSLIGMIVASQTVAQVLEDIVLSPGEFVAFVVPFVTLSLVAIWLLIVLLRNVSEVGDRQNHKLV